MRPFTDHEQNLLATDQWRELAHLRGELLESLHDQMRRWEDQAIGAENQRDEALAQLDRSQSHTRGAIATLKMANDGWASAIEERDTAQRLLASFQQLLENSRRETQAYIDAYNAAIAERDEWLDALKREQAKHLETLKAMKGRTP